jgi:glycosyltransferase involved in cell wall biosynthesis
VKVAYVLKRYPRLSETFVVNEISGLEAAGISVQIHALGFPKEPRFHASIAAVHAPVDYVPSAASGIAESLDLLRDPQFGARYGEVMDFLDRVSPDERTALLVAGLHVAASARTAGVDHLHAHFMTSAAHVACVAHLFSGIPFSVTAHAKDIFTATVDRKLFQAVAARAETIITVSDYNVGFIRRNLLGETQASITRIYNGLNAGGRAAAPRLRDRRVLLAVGRLVPKKGFDLAIEALQDLPVETELVIIGDGEERDRLERLTERLRLGSRVTFLGSQRNDVVADWMGRARMLVAPFVVDADGNQDALPTVLIEALCAGLPVVTANIAGVPEIIDDGVTGYVVPTGSRSALVDRIVRLLRDDDVHAVMSASGPAIAFERFDHVHTIPAWLQAIGAGPVWVHSLAGGMS